jgi:hypothetical protein
MFVLRSMFMEGIAQRGFVGGLGLVMDVVETWRVLDTSGFDLFNFMSTPEDFA